MIRMSSRTSAARGLLAAALLAAVSLPAWSHSGFLSSFTGNYPGSQTDDNVIQGTGSSCALCHFSTSGGNNYNAYGWRIRLGMNSGMNASQAILAAEPFDSDSDPTGSDNLTEILADAQPGWTPGPNNTRYNGNGSTQTGLMPPAGILGNLDPGCTGTVTTYCTASTTSIAGCSASISGSGTPSASSPSGFTISSGSVPGGNVGIMYFSNGGPASILIGTQGGFVCATPGFRTGPKGSGGSSGSCNGDYQFTLQDLVLAGGVIVNPGTTINGAIWFRDPASPDTFGLSNGIEFVVCP